MTFYYPVDPLSRVSWKYNPPGHNGIDFAIVTGTPIYSSQAGRVSVAREDKTGYGTHVRIEHEIDGVKRLTIYGHLSKLLVAVGDVVDIHTKIGLSGSTGNSTGPHLHYELRNSWSVWSSSLNPLPLYAWDGETAPEIPPTIPPEILPEFPILPQAVVIVPNGLNVRSGPGTNNSVVGVLHNGDIVDVIFAVPDNDNLWLRIGWRQYCAMKYNGAVYAEWKA